MRRYRPRKELVITLGKWKPLPSQLQFMKMKQKYRFFLGGYGSGKTFALGVEMLRLCIANKKRQGMIVAPTYGILMRTTLPSFLRLIPKDAISSIHKADKYIKLVNGVKVFWGSSDNPEGLEGTNLSFFGVDEGADVSEKAWTILKGRLRVPCKRISGIIVGTPGPGWMEEAILGDDAGVVHATSRENVHNDESYVAGLLNSYSEEDIARYVDGRFTLSQGLVYKDFNEDNIMDYKWTPGDCALYASVDFGYNYPACLYIAHIPTDNGFIDVVVDELVPDNIKAADFAQQIRKYNASKGYIITEYYGDHAGNHVRDDGRTSIMDFRDNGVNVKTNPRWKDRRLGISLVRGRLRDSEGHRRLFVSKELWDRFKSYRKVKRGICKDLTTYRYPPADSTEIKKDLPSERLNILSEHTMDALRYYITKMYRHQSASSGDFVHRDVEVSDNAWDAFSDEIIDNDLLSDEYFPMAGQY